ncbi:MAG: MASE3 domain-containing protein [Armatimonadota bacterium]
MKETRTSETWITANWRYIKTGVMCILLLIVAYVLQLIGSRIRVDYFLPAHLVFEFTSIVVSFAVFTTGWFGYRQTGSTRDLIIALTFFTAGSFDLIHTLSYKGMPAFLGTNTVGNAAAYWLLARLVVGVGLVWAAMVHVDARSKQSTALKMTFAMVLIIGMFTTILTIFGDHASSIVYNSRTQSLTGLKIALEYVSILTYLIAFAAISETHGWERKSADLLRRALLIAIFAEIAFTGYSSPYDWTNMLGHVLKAAAYYLILNALFVTAIRKPYDELSQAKEEMHSLYLDAQEHRKEIERSFSRIGSALSSSLQLDEALTRISELTVDMLHADCAIVASLEHGKEGVKVAAQKDWCIDESQPVELTLQVGRQAIEQQHTIIENNLQAKEKGQAVGCLRSMVCAPMIYESTPLGMIAIYSQNQDAFEDGDVKLLEAFATHAAVAIHNALSYERESRIADVLQRSILSSGTIVTENFEIAQVYEPAINEALIGGDFYDLIELTDGRVGLVIGDVSGKGLKAAVHTAMVKYTLRAYVREGHSASEAVELLNKAVYDATNAETFITMFLGILDTRTGEMIYTNAGHEPPVYAHNGEYITLDSTGPALGLGMTGYTESRLVLKKGSILLLYTDGISEARRGHNFLGTERIGDELLVCDDLDSKDIAKCVHSAALSFAGGELKDDAAILAVRAR